MNAKKIKGGNLSVYKLPLHQCRKWINHKAKTRKCAFGKSLWCKKKVETKTNELDNKNRYEKYKYVMTKFQKAFFCGYQNKTY